MTPETNFFYSNLFVAIVTFIVGTFGLYLYHRRKNDNTRRIAKTILTEIQAAETQLNDAEKRVDASNPLPEHMRIMPTDTWTPNKHLFVGDFTPNEIEALNHFYAQCEIVDKAFRHNDTRFAEDEKEIRKNVHNATYEYAKKYSPLLLQEKSPDKRTAILEDFFKERDALVDMLTNGDFIRVYTPAKQNEEVIRNINTIETNLSLTSVGSKLEKLSKNKFGIF